MVKNIIDEVKARLEPVFTGSIVSSYERFDPTLRESWIRISVLPSESNNVTQGIDSILEDNGIIQISLFTPSNTDINFDIANNILTELLNKRLFPSFQIDRAWRGTDLFETDWTQTPILIRYRLFKDNIGVNDGI